MYHLSMEYRYLNSSYKNAPASLADNIARHIREYQIYGKVVVVADDPSKLLTDIRKAWKNLKHEMRNDIDHTEDDSRKSLLINQLMYMQNCSFTTKPPIADSNERVTVATIEQILEWPPACQTMYVTCDIESSELHRATALMPSYGLLVVYQLMKEGNMHESED